jgi:hypothetical protein
MLDPYGRLMYGARSGCIIVRVRDNEIGWDSRLSEVGDLVARQKAASERAVLSLFTMPLRWTS